MIFPKIYKNLTELKDIPAAVAGKFLKRKVDNSGFEWDVAGGPAFTGLWGAPIFEYEVSGSAVAQIDTGDIFAGDTDKYYMLLYKFYANTNPTHVGLHFNGDAGQSYKSIRHFNTSNNNGGNDSYPGTLVGIPLCILNGTNINTIGRALILPRAIGAAWRQMLAETSYIAPNSDYIERNNFLGVWKNNATNITSMQFYADVVNGIGVGSSISIYKSR